MSQISPQSVNKWLKIRMSIFISTGLNQEDMCTQLNTHLMKFILMKKIKKMASKWKLWDKRLPKNMVGHKKALRLSICMKCLQDSGLKMYHITVRHVRRNRFNTIFTNRNLSLQHLSKILQKFLPSAWMQIKNSWEWRNLWMKMMMSQ